MNLTVELVAAFVVAVVATSRLTRLFVDDDWPPIVRLREWWVMRVSEGWAVLVDCPFCVAVYVAGVNVGAWMAAYFIDVEWVWWLWWVPNVFLTVAYLAAILNTRDIPLE